MTFAFQVTLTLPIDEGTVDITNDVIEVRWFNGLREAYQDFADDPWCEIDIDNTSGLYSPESATSPYSGVLTEGVVKVYLILNGVSTQMWHGFTRHIDVDVAAPGPEFAMKVTLVCSGPYDRLRDITATGTFGTNKNTGLLMVTALQNGGYSDFSKIQTGKTTIPDFANQMNDISVLNAMMAITQVERGRFFWDRDGVPEFWHRHNLIATNSSGLSSQITIDSDPPAPYRPYALDYQYDNLFANIVRVTMNPTQTAASSETLWELDNEIKVGGGDLETFEIKLKRSGTEQPGRATALSTSGATWADSTEASISVTAYGSRADLTLDNSANTTAAILTALTVTGTPEVSQNAITYEVTGSNPAHAMNTVWSVTIPALASIDDGKYIAQFELDRRDQHRGNVNAIEFAAIGDGDNNAHFIMDYGDRITINERKLNHEQDYYMIGEEHTVRADGWHHARIIVEPAEAQQYWVLGLPNFSTLGQTTYLGY